MISWYYLVVAACLLLVFLLYKEWTGKKRSFLYGRLLASLLAVGSLLLMAWPALENNKETVKKLVLLTNGFIKDSVDNFLKNSNGILVFSVTPVQNYTGSRVQPVTDLHSFAVEYPADTLHVFGNGFSDEALVLLNPHPIVFHATPAIPCISNIYWKQYVEAGEPLVLQGCFENNSQQKIKLVLQAFGAGKDSVFIAAGARQHFQLHTIPAHTGKAVYSLLVTAGSDTLQKEPIPVEVQTTTPLQLLIIASSPDFDNTYLKNHLSQQGYQVTIVTTVSTNKTNKQFLNMPAQAAGARLTAAYLDKFDVLMTDEEALQKITMAEQSAIRTAVQEKGTGLIIKLDGEHRQAFYSRFFPVKEGPKGRESFLQLHHISTDSNQYKIKVSEPVSILYTTGAQMILQDAQANIYAAGVLYGGGKIIGSTLQNTYSMALEGNKTAYQQLWWLMLNTAAKKVYPEESWHTRPPIAFVNDPVQMQVEKTALVNSAATIEQTNIYLKQDSLLPFIWNGLYWPVTAGWQQLPHINTITGSWYINKAGDWQRLLDHQHAAATKKYAVAHSVTGGAAVQTEQRLPVNWQLYLLLIFLGACIFLWVEQKAG